MKTKLLTTLALSLLVTACSSKEEYAFEDAPDLMQTKPTASQLMAADSTNIVEKSKSEPKIIEIDGIQVELNIEDSSLAAVEDESAIEEIVILASDGTATAGKQLEIGQETIVASMGSIELAPIQATPIAQPAIQPVAKAEPRIVYVKQMAPQKVATTKAIEPQSLRSMPSNLMARDIVASTSSKVMGTSYQKLAAAPAPKTVQPVYEYKRAMAPLSSPSESDYDISCDIPSLKDTTASYKANNQPKYVYNNDAVKSYRYSY